MVVAARTLEQRRFALESTCAKGRPPRALDLDVAAKAGRGCGAWCSHVAVETGAGARIEAIGAVRGRVELEIGRLRGGIVGALGGRALIGRFLPHRCNNLKSKESSTY